LFFYYSAVAEVSEDCAGIDATLAVVVVE